MLNEINNLVCRVCGKIQNDPPWGEDSQCPTYDICDCCGTEFGYGDCTVKAIRASRERWLTNGTKWKYPKEKPINWSLEEQMKNIPEKYK
ncbi:MAG: hypothetical protein V4494_05385 [Chlamydiota bacterium]